MEFIYDDFDTQIQPEELTFQEDILDDNPIDEDFDHFLEGDFDADYEEPIDYRFDDFSDGEFW